MKSPGLFLKAAAPLASTLLVLASVLLLRAELRLMGAVCLLLALVGFILGIRMVEYSPFTADELERLKPFVQPGIAWLAVAALVLVSVLNVADNFTSPGTNRLAAGTWIAGILLGFALVWGPRLRGVTQAQAIQKIRAHRLELGAIAAILIGAFALRTIGLSMHPYPWSGDEASIGSEAIRILRGEVTNFFETGWSSQPNWSFLPTALTEALFGHNIVAVRLTSVVAGTLAVLFVWLAGRELFDPTVGLAAAAFLATLAYHIHFSRVGVNNVVDSLMSAMVFWLLAAAVRKDSVRWYYSAGAAAGLCIYTYAGTRLVALLALGVVLFLVVRNRGYFASHIKHLGAFAAAAAISAAPQMAFFSRHWDIFMGRLGQEGIFFNGWLAQQSAQTGKSAAQILFDQFTRTTLVFIGSPAVGNFFNSPRPYLTILASVLFVVGMAYAIAYCLQFKYFVLLIWFWAVVLLGGIITLNPPANTRMLMTTPAVAILMAVGAVKLLDYLSKINVLGRRSVPLLLGLLAAIIAYQNVSFYMFEYRRNLYFQDPNGEYGMEVGRLVSEWGGDYQVYVLGAPRVFSGFPTLPFAAPGAKFHDLDVAGLASFEPPAGTGLAFFAIPENRALLDAIRQRFPGGRDGVKYRLPRPGEILFEYYLTER